MLNAGAARTNFCVKPRPVEDDVPTTIQADLLEQMWNFEWEKYQAGEIPNARMISPWLMRTGWHEHILPYIDNVAKLCDLVAMPKDNKFPELHMKVKEYFHQATIQLDAMDELVHQRLNSANPDKE
ncbi:hypothetical protein B0H10DRAFT_2221834 [Mycena sp. CBHHK59/15]|nr:hypothetical protein B0H10DRAFT_2221834 [Mycena sp. CBHHK59/15]